MMPAKTVFLRPAFLGRNSWKMSSGIVPLFCWGTNYSKILEIKLKKMFGNKVQIVWTRFRHWIAIIIQNFHKFLSNSIQLFTIDETPPAYQQKQLYESIDQFGLMLEQKWITLVGMRSASHSQYPQVRKQHPKPSLSLPHARWTCGGRESQATVTWYTE